MAGDRRLELARQVRDLGIADEGVDDRADRRRRVDDLVGGDAGHRRAQDHARGVAAGLGGLQADGLETLPDLRNVFDPHPVQLDVLAVGDVGGVTGELHADLGDSAQLGEVQGAAVDAHPHHEVLVGQFVGRQAGGASAVDALPALGVQTPPAQAAVQVISRDGGEAFAGVDLLNAGPDVQAVVGRLEFLVVVQRLLAVDEPLPVTAALAGWPDACAGRGICAHLGFLGLWPR